MRNTTQILNNPALILVVTLGVIWVQSDSLSDGSLPDGYFDYTVGNKWTYRVTSEVDDSFEYRTIEILECEKDANLTRCEVDNFGVLIIENDSLLISDFVYNEMEQLEHHDPGLLQFYAVDALIDSTWDACWDCSENAKATAAIYDTTTTSLFGEEVKQKAISIVADDWLFLEFYMVEKFGLLGFLPHHGYSWQLVGAEINGVTYGNVVSLEKHNSRPGKSFEVRPAYPNPFNPSFNIALDVEMPVEISISVYDVLGREVIKKANRTYGVGIHSIHINTNNTASGIFYIHVSSSDYTHIQSIAKIK